MTVGFRNKSHLTNMMLKTPSAGVTQWGQAASLEDMDK